MSKTYKVVSIQGDIMDLIDTDKQETRIMAAPGEFMEGEILTDEDFYIHKCLLLGENRIESQELAFRLIQY